MDSKMLVTVGLSRYSSGGMITLEFDGATSTVLEVIEMMRRKQDEERKALQEQQTKIAARPVSADKVEPEFTEGI